jgi:opacity protein-like surface antigen
MRPPLVAIVTALALAAVAAFAGAADDAAMAAAHGWLATVDAGDYGRSWDQAAAYFRGAVGKPDWERTIAGVRSPLGRVLERKLKSATVTRTLPGAPDGEYVVIQYATRFEHKAAAVETVTPKREPDRAWRVAGYFIR